MQKRKFFLTFLGLAALAALLCAAPIGAADNGYSYARIVRLSLVSRR
jgi:hypothetical protein